MEDEIRADCFLWLKEQCQTYGAALPWSILQKGFPYKGERVTIVGATGIWKPKQLETMPISILTTFENPYHDGFDEEGFLVYHYRGKDPEHRDNFGLRQAWATRTPLVYFHAISKGIYVPVWPMFIMKDDPDSLTCLGAVDPAYATGDHPPHVADLAGLKDPESMLGVRKYIAAFTMKRVHQAHFREAVVSAYSDSCALCKLRHRELLDAAHIIGDTKPKGDPVVPNGLCLCKIHHAAFDENIIGISPDYVIKVRDDILREKDGPMLAHGLQGLHQGTIHLPKKFDDRPDKERLALRYEEFLKAV
jgi:putative restriction endonuclease